MAANPPCSTGARPLSVLFITSDQQRGDCFGFEGRKVKTPHLDLLARQGYRVEDHLLTTRAETDAFKAAHGVDTTTQALMRMRNGGFIRLPSDEPEEPTYFKSLRRAAYY